MYWYLIWRTEAFKYARELEVDIAAKSTTDHLLESLIELMGEGIKAMMESFKMLAEVMGARF